MIDLRDHFCAVETAIETAGVAAEDASNNRLSSSSSSRSTNRRSASSYRDIDFRNARLHFGVGLLLDPPLMARLGRCPIPEMVPIANC